MEIHQPDTPAEKDLVDQMVAARWRVLRLQSIESGLLDSEMRQKKKLELEFPSGCSVTLSDAYQGQANGYTAMALASRCESRFHRMYLSSYKVLRELQAARAKQSTPPAVPEPTQPEPPPPVAAEVKTQPANPPSARQPEEQICGNESGPHPKSEIPTSEIPIGFARSENGADFATISVPYRIPIPECT